MSALRGTKAGADLMAQVRAHKGGGVAAKTKKKPAADVEDAADKASEPGGEPANEKSAAVAFMNKRRKAVKKT